MRRRWSSLRKPTAVMVAGVLVAVVATGVAVAATLSLSTSHLGAGQVTTPPLFPDSLALTNVGGGPAHQTGKADPGDTITVVYSEPLDAATVCAGVWSGTGTQTTALTVEVDGNKAAAANGDDTMTVLATSGAPACTGGFQFGTIDMGGVGFFTSPGAAKFNKSPVTLTQTATQATLVFTLGSLKSGTAGRINSSVTASYTPDTGLQNGSGTGIGANSAAHTGVQF